MIERHRKSILFREVWFDEPWSPDGADVVLFYHWSKPVQPDKYHDVYSLEIDLGQTDEEIWHGFTGSTRNQINRGTKEGLQFTAWEHPSRETVEEFGAFYGQFSTQRGWEAATPDWMLEYAAQNALVLTRASAADGRVLVWHSYYRDKLWVRQLQSVSFYATQDDKQERNLVARANRYLHWMDMQECRKLGCRHFDFGGWYHGDADEKLLRINSFKEEFGGVKTHRYHSMLPVSAKGKLFLTLRKQFRNTSELLHVV